MSLDMFKGACLKLSYLAIKERLWKYTSCCALFPLLSCIVSRLCAQGLGGLEEARYMFPHDKTSTDLSFASKFSFKL
ncbi:hypothetical protein J437_LFUL002094 [Ladona fulva]|uniref:Uncharacterized protein n=1 Tax=Ladona fulva TaxID=123851 RepID=A0A8K0NXQ6_LADFU|nr:hypothetical protein J437_LFUL002094 [Ladona fulva]